MTLYHGTSAVYADSICSSGLKRAPDGSGPFVTPSRELALTFAAATVAANAYPLGGCLHGALFTVSTEEDVLGGQFTERLLSLGIPRHLQRTGPAGWLAREVRAEECRVEVIDVWAFTREQLATLLAVVHPRYRLLFRFMAATGVRVSEAIAIQWQHLALDGSSPHVKVRRAIVRGRVQPPKSKHGRRDVPLDQAVVSELAAP